MAAAASPVAKAAAPITIAFAASTRPRPGLAASVVRIRPRRYSAVMNIVPTTTTTISPANVPTRAWLMSTPPPEPGTSGAISPDPVTVNLSPAWRNPPGACGYIAFCPISVPRHPPVQRPATPTWSKVPVARVGPPTAVDPPSDAEVTCVN